MNQLPLSTRGLFSPLPFARKIIKINLWNQGSVGQEISAFNTKMETLTDKIEKTMKDNKKTIKKLRDCRTKVCVIDTDSALIPRR
jgi:hypothetical protein